MGLERLQALQADAEAARRDRHPQLQHGYTEGPTDRSPCASEQLCGSHGRSLLDPSTPAGTQAAVMPLLAGDVIAAHGHALQSHLPHRVADGLPVHTAAAAPSPRSCGHAVRAATSSPGLQKGGSTDSASLIGLSGEDRARRVAQVRYDSSALLAPALQCGLRSTRVKSA